MPRPQSPPTHPTTLSVVLALFTDAVPTVFRWEHGGRQVYITGTFNNWEQQIPMHRSGNDFTYIHNLKKVRVQQAIAMADETFFRIWWKL